MSKIEPYLTVYVSSWDEPSRRYIENLSGFRHKLIDIDKNRDIAETQKIKAVPTTQFYINEELKATKIGCGTVDMIEKWIEEIV